MIVKLDTTRGGFKHTQDQTTRRRFTAPAFADQAKRLALLNIKIDTINRTYVRDSAIKYPCGPRGKVLHQTSNTQ